VTAGSTHPLSALQCRLLLVTTAVAVVSDATLIPFYPKLFADAFAVTDPQHVGLYLAATCLTVMVALPFWARLEREIPTLQLLLVGQFCAGLLSLACFSATRLYEFWLLSLGVIVFKTSYLLVYPYVMRLEAKSKHADTIALLTVIVHLGGIAGAAMGGALLESFAPQTAFIVMAAGDFLQMGVCVWLLAKGARAPTAAEAEANTGVTTDRTTPAFSLTQLSMVMLIYYFAVFVVRPFFVPYWTMRTTWDSELLSGWIFSIPAWMSLGSLAVRRHRKPRPVALGVVLAVGCAGLVLQSFPFVAAIVVGRCVFGWSVFRAMVDLDLMLFEMSAPESYARNFSYMNFCQQLGVLVAFYAAGAAVSSGGLVLPFVIAVFGFVATGVAHTWIQSSVRRWRTSP